jgi:hypothetical protein
MREVME